MAKDLIVFDVDGTLVDSSALLVEAQRRTFEHFAIPFPGREPALAVVGLSLPEAFAAHVGDEGPAGAMADHYRSLFGDLRADPTYGEALFHGADEALRMLARRPGGVIGIATGKSQRGVARLVERHGWTNLFATIQTADDAPSKPHPAMLQQAVRDAGADPKRTIMVGDSSYDIEMAAAAGVRSIAVAWGFQPLERLKQCGATEIVARFADLPPLVARMLD